MKTREEIQNKFNSNLQRIKELESENEELQKQNMLISDEKQWFIEQMETITKRVNRKKVTEEKLIGKVYWKEDFKDRDTGKTFTVERNIIVRVNGVWL